MGIRPHQTESSGRAQPAPAEEKVDIMPKRHLEGSTPEARAKIRKQLGTLKELTVQPVTRARYSQAREAFYKWLKEEDIFLPHSAYQLDLVVSDYLEALWHKGKDEQKGLTP